MRVIAASFAELEVARDSLRRLTVDAGVPADDVRVAPHADGYVLGVRFPKELHADVCRVLQESGGRLLVDVPESWTRGTGYDPVVPDQDPAPASDRVAPAIRAHGAPA